MCAVCLKQKRHSIVLTVVTTYNSSSEKSKFSDSTISGVSSFSSMARTHVLFCERRKRCVIGSRRGVAENDVCFLREMIILKKIEKFKKIELINLPSPCPSADL